ncbi:MAG: B12-binding domain-containing radical SAM protein [Spirochaetia bacterium]
MKILFVRPRPSPETIGLQHVMIVEPLELETLAALVGRMDSPVIVDMILERKPFAFYLRREKPDALCITGYITHVGIMREYCRIAKQWNPGIRTIVGGVHCEVCPDDLDDPAVDFRVVRNATTTFPRLLSAIRSGGDVPKGVLAPGRRMTAADLPPLDFAAPLPLRWLTDRYRSRYFYIFHDRVALLKTAFRCPFTCTFCFCRAITGGRYVARPLEDVMTELEAIKEKEIYIVDDDFLVDRDRVLAFISENRRRGLDKRYLLYGRADFIAHNPEVMRELKSIGLTTVIVGFESFFQEELAHYRKGTSVTVNCEAMAVLRKNGIDCYATVIIPPEWDSRRFAECGAIMKSLGIHYVNLQPLTPLPGTGHEVSDGRLVINRGDYPQWDLAHIAIRPEHLTVRQFYKALIDLYDQILFPPAILRDYLGRYRLSQIWKMAVGIFRVRHQYMRKMKEAAHGDA